MFPTGGFCHHLEHKTLGLCAHSNSPVDDLEHELCHCPREHLMCPETVWQQGGDWPFLLSVPLKCKKTASKPQHSAYLLAASGFLVNAGASCSACNTFPGPLFIRWSSLRCSKPLAINCHQVLGKPVAPTALRKIACKPFPVSAPRSHQSGKLGILGLIQA